MSFQQVGENWTDDPRAGAVQPDATQRELYDGGMAVRREVLGAAHVDRANENTTELTAEFQNMITRTAWGGIWSRPGLSRKMRNLGGRRPVTHSTWSNAATGQVQPLVTHRSHSATGQIQKPRTPIHD